MAAMLPGMEAVRYPDWASLLERWWRDAPEGTVLALDEFPYLAKASPELPSVLQRLIDQNRSRRLHLVLCGSSQRMMQGLVLDASAPLYGRARQLPFADSYERVDTCLFVAQAASAKMASKVVSATDVLPVCD